jgi:hypothetical protein
MIFSIFPLFVTLVLELSTLFLRSIEGLSGFATSSLDYVSGYISDKTGKRRKFAVLGYSFSTLRSGSFHNSPY